MGFRLFTNFTRNPLEPLIPVLILLPGNGAFAPSRDNHVTKGSYQMSAHQGQSASGHGNVATSRELEQKLVALDKRLDELVQADWRGRLGLLAATAGLLAMILWFASSLWRMAEQRFTEETLQAAVMAKVEDRWPSIQQKLLDEITVAAPTFTTLAGERAMEVFPELSDRVVNSLATVGPELEADIRSRSEEAMRRVATKVTADLQRDFPSFTPERATAITERVREELLADGSGFVDSLDGVIKQEQEKVLGVLAKFPVEAAASQPEEALHKKFIHHVLMMVDAIVAQYPVPGENALLNEGQAESLASAEAAAE